MPQIIDFNNNRIITNSTPIAPSLALFDETGAFVTSSDNLFIDRIVVTATGSGFIGTPSIVLTMITGSVITSASAFTTNDTGKLTTVRLTNNGVFSLDAKISGSVSASIGSGSGATVFVSTTRTKQISSVSTKLAIYDSFDAAKDKVKLVLYTRKGEVPRMPNLGTRMYEKLLNFDQVQSLDDFVEQTRIILALDIEQQVPEVEILEARINETETDLDKNKIGISLIFRHKLSRKTSTIDLSLNDSNLQTLKEYFTNENAEQRAVRYFK